MTSPRPLDPAVVRIVEALADLMVDRDIARIRGISSPAAAPRATVN
ncbi:hypothetical protein MOK15_00500 [Sphingobium sp. BYY-5]|nr:hypothetical protein [Sphingobium sp. BYY-5]MCI4588588.1 hypothetical protein [Sphingobium sp. BYY-5]